MHPETSHTVDMKLLELAFIVTDDCNFRCSYCRQTKENKYLSQSAIKKAVDFFYPFMAPQSNIIFYGGEPLLAFESIQYTVAQFLQKNPSGQKKQRFCLTTNGSLLTQTMLEFFNAHSFYLLLSFDNLTQDSARQAGSFAPLLEKLQTLQRRQYPQIVFTTNSVFAPATVSHLSESLEQLMQIGFTDITFELDRSVPWDTPALETLDAQLARLAHYLLVHYKKTGTIPVLLFRPAIDTTPRVENIAYCNGGADRFAISPDEIVWGCVQFHDYLKAKTHDPDFNDYAFGKLDHFIAHHETLYPKILENYTGLRMDNYFTNSQSCYLCPDVEVCSVCPVTLAYATQFIGKLPEWYCHIGRIRRKHKNLFLNHIKLEQNP